MASCDTAQRGGAATKGARRCPQYVFSALRTRHVWSESAGLAVAAAFGVRQLVGAFARGTAESAVSWLALAEDSGDKSPHSKRWRDCETAAWVPTPGLCDALNRYRWERAGVRASMPRHPKLFLHQSLGDKR